MRPLHSPRARHSQHQHAALEQEEPADFLQQERQLTWQGVASVTVSSAHKKLPWLSAFIGASSGTQTCTGGLHCSPVRTGSAQRLIADIEELEVENLMKHMMHSSLITLN